MKDRGNLDYTEACIFESMRLSNFIGFGIPHMTVCDSQVGEKELIFYIWILLFFLYIELSKIWKQFWSIM